MNIGSSKRYKKIYCLNITLVVPSNFSKAIAVISCDVFQKIFTACACIYMYMDTYVYLYVCI